MADSSYIWDEYDLDDEDEEPVAGRGAGASYGALSAADYELPPEYREQYEYGKAQQRRTTGALDTIERDLATTAAAKKAAIQAGLERLLAQRPDYTTALMGAAAGFLKPTRGGTFWESLGAASGEALAPVAREQDKTEARRLKQLEYQLAGVGADEGAAKDRLAIALKRGELGTKAATDALRLNERLIALRSRNAGAQATADWRKSQAANQDSKLQLLQRRLELEEGKAPKDERTPLERQVDALHPLRPDMDPAEKQEVMENRRTELRKLLTTTKEKPDDDPEETPEQRAAEAEALSVPPLTLDPYRGMSRRGREQAITRFMAQGQKEIDEGAVKAGELTGLSQAAQRFVELNAKVTTGPQYLVPGSHYISSDTQEMQSLADKVTPGMRSGMPGAASDRDVAMFRSATFGLTKSYQTNQNIATAFQAAAKNANDRVAFKEAYLQAHRTLTGAEGAWQKYLNANPIFDHSKPGESFTLNAERKTWQEHFGKKKEWTVERP